MHCIGTYGLLALTPRFVLIDCNITAIAIINFSSKSHVQATIKQTVSVIFTWKFSDIVICDIGK